MANIFEHWKVWNSNSSFVDFAALIEIKNIAVGVQFDDVVNRRVIDSGNNIDQVINISGFLQLLSKFFDVLVEYESIFLIFNQVDLRKVSLSFSVNQIQYDVLVFRVDASLLIRAIFFNLFLRNSGQLFLWQTW